MGVWQCPVCKTYQSGKHDSECALGRSWDMEESSRAKADALRKRAEKAEKELDLLKVQFKLANDQITKMRLMP